MRTLCLCAILVCVLGSIATAADAEVYATMSCRTEITSPDTNRHDSSKLSIRGDASSAKSWIRFNLEEYDLSVVRGAVLRVTLHEDKGTGTFDVSAVNDDVVTNIQWVDHNDNANPEEGIYALTWMNAPGNDTASYTSLAAGTFMGTVTIVEGNTAAGSQYFVDVTSAIQADTDGIVQFVLHNSSGLKNCSTHDHPQGEAYFPMLILSLPPEGADWPSPADGATVNTSLSTLSWDLPEPNVPGYEISCDVYFGTEPNVLTMDIVSLAAGVNSIDINTDNFPTHGNLVDNTTYYWWVDCYDPSRIPTLIPGEVWTFDTYNNDAPIADAGADQVTWLTNDPNTITLTGAASDDGLPSATLTYTWAVTAGPETAVIDSPNTLSTLVTFTETGDYTFTLTANDGELDGSDEVRVVVGALPCDASHVFTGNPYNDADANQDCLVDIADFVELFAEDWLDCSDTLNNCGL